MKRILKYPLSLPTTATSYRVRMPASARVIHFELQFNTPTIWVEAECDSYVEPGPSSHVVREFVLKLTGDKVEPYLDYVGTFLRDEGNFVGHVYQVRP